LKHLHLDKVGLMTHHADSYLMASLPEAGDYFIQISDSQQQGGKEYGYRLRISRGRPDFALRATPSGFFVQPGGHIPVCVYALREDGYTGPIKIKVKEGSGGFIEDPSSVIPAKADHAWITLTAPAVASGEPANLELEGFAQINGVTVRREVVAADNTMQAFLWRHLVPVEQTLYMVKKQKWRSQEMALADRQRLILSPGTTKNVKVKLNRRRFKAERLKELVFVVHEAPDGVTIDRKITPVPGGISFDINLAADTKAKGYRGNLIVEVMQETMKKQKNGKSKKNRRSVGYLPAIPIKIAGQ
jgi:hypothetical protein